MPKKNQQFIQSSIQDLLHLLEQNPEMEHLIGRFRLMAVLGFLIEMTEAYPIDADHKKRLVEVRDVLVNTPPAYAVSEVN